MNPLATTLRQLSQLFYQWSELIEQTETEPETALSLYRSDKRVMAICYFLCIIEPKYYEGTVKAWEVPSIEKVKKITGGVIDKYGHTYMTDWMAGQGIIFKKQHHTSKWLGAWNPRRLRRYLHHKILPCPLPQDDPPAQFFIREQITDRTDSKAQNSLDAATINKRIVSSGISPD